MSKEYVFKDAKKPFTLHVNWEDINGTLALGPPIPGDSRNCVLSRSGRREHNIFKIELWRTVAYVWKHEASVPTRYQVTQAAHDLLVSFDASGRSHPITVTLIPPRHALSQKYQRERRQAAKRSRERSKKRAALRDKARREAEKRVRAAGRKVHRRRAYTKPDPLTLLGVRNGTGRAGRGR